ncbi:YqaJ viral recombinase family protein [Bifidobacterium jacchi]|uniref:Endonuclease n=1 Tax=Bifidobacterium jacchi TaxID=2490545 RepID=A0A5N5RN54_9BIFI|nr:YqaJ viral recombinase family protein [Bifidobacterium jacchi]KAB5608389.1 endonuclease [Bifidobacterium jacchi]
MSRVTLDQAQRSTGLFTMRRFKGSGTTKASRRDAWLQFRTLGVGGSDMGTILGLNPYATPYDLWLEKTGRVEPEDISGKWAVIKGNALEVELRRRFRALHPEYKVIDGTDVSVVSKQHPTMHASLDGWLYDPDTDSWGILEIKTANAARGRTDWHDDDNDPRIPDYYMAQVTHYMAVTGFTWGYVYADIGEAEPVAIRFDRDEQDVKTVVKAAEEFWRFVTDDRMPRLKGVDVAKAYPEPSTGMETCDDDAQLAELMGEYERAKERAEKAKADLDVLRDSLIVRIGDSTGVRCRGWEATYRHWHRDGYTRVVKPSDGRTFRFRTLKEGR